MNKANIKYRYYLDIWDYVLFNNDVFTIDILNDRDKNYNYTLDDYIANILFE